MAKTSQPSTKETKSTSTSTAQEVGKQSPTSTSTSKPEGDENIISPLEDELSPLDKEDVEVNEVSSTSIPVIPQVKDINAAISSRDLDAVNAQVGKLRFCLQRDTFIAVEKVLQIHEDGRLDIRIAPHHVPAPTGMRGMPSAAAVNRDYLKVSRDDFGRDAGKYRVVES